MGLIINGNFLKTGWLYADLAGLGGGKGLAGRNKFVPPGGKMSGKIGDGKRHGFFLKRRIALP
jgi:hypothetical protein